MAKEESALNAAITEAAAELTAAAEQETPQGGEATEETSAGEESGSEETIEDGEETPETPGSDELNEAQLAEAQKLYRLLSDPKQRGPLIAALAQDVGLLNRETPPTKKEEVKAAKAIKEVIADALGPEFKFLADRLAPAIETVVGQVSERQESVIQQQQLEKITQETVAATEKLAKETKGASVKLEKRMQELADEMPPGKGISVERYIRRLYSIAASEAGIVPTTQNGKTNVQKVRTNANNAADRLHGTTGSGRVEPKIPNKKMNINDAVQFAYGELAKGK